MITVITLLRGSRAYTARWSDAWRHMEKPDGTSLILGVNNDFDRQAGVELGARVFPTTTPSEKEEIHRINHIATIYEMIVPQVTTPLVLIWEDDILPPPGSISKLAAGLPEDAAGIVSVTPYHDGFEPKQVILFWSDNEIPTAQASLPTSGIEQVFGGGTAYSLWRTAELAQSLPWTVREELGGVIPGWDITLARKLRDAGKKTVVDLAVRCYHG